MEQQTFDIKTIFGDKLAPKYVLELEHLWKEGKIKGSNDNAIFDISDSGTQVRIIIPEDGVRFRDGKGRTLTRTDKTLSKSIYEEGGKKKVTAQRLHIHCTSEFQTEMGVYVTIQVVRYNRTKPSVVPTATYKWELRQDREGGILKPHFDTELHASLTPQQAAIYYFFLFSHWNEENPLGGIFTEKMNYVGIFKEVDEMEIQKKKDAIKDAKYDAMTFYRKIRDNTKKINTFATKFNEIYPKSPYYDALRSTTEWKNKREAISQMVESDVYCQKVLSVAEKLGDFAEMTMEDMKEMVANGFKMGVFYFDIEKNGIRLNTSKSETADFTMAHETSDLATRDFMLYETPEKEAYKSESFCAYVLDRVDNETWQIIFEQTRMEMKAYPTGESPNYRYSDKTNKFTATYNTWAKKNK